MAQIQKIAITLVFVIAVTYGASIGMEIRPQMELLSSNTTYFPKVESNRDGPVVEYSVSPSYLSVADSEDTFAVGKVIAEVVRTVMDVVSKMDLTEQSFRNMVQLILPIVSVYWGPYSQVILPILSGIASVLIKSIAH